MADHNPDVPDGDVRPEAGERAPLQGTRVLLPEEPPLLTPAAAGVLLRILRRASGQVHKEDQSTIEDGRKAA